MSSRSPGIAVEDAYRFSRLVFATDFALQVDESDNNAAAGPNYPERLLKRSERIIDKTDRTHHEGIPESAVGEGQRFRNTSMNVNPEFGGPFGHLDRRLDADRHTKLRGKSSGTDSDFKTMMSLFVK
jgi:hypothetical protein